MNTTSSKLRKLRAKKTQEQVAQDLGVSLSAYVKYENGIRVPRDDIKRRIATYYNSTVQDIFLVSSTRYVYRNNQKGEYMKKVTISLDELIGEVKDKTEHKKSNAERREELIELLFDYLKREIKIAEEKPYIDNTTAISELTSNLINLLA